jgi:PadR family transcriptional regulator PadR
VLGGPLDLLLLAALAEGPSHGYAVIERLRSASGGRFDYPEGTIYPALHRLESDRLLRSRWSDANGRRRRVYELTRKGQEALAEQRRDWHDLVRGVAAVVDRA